MVKGGTKRKIQIEKITQKNSLATCFTKRSYGLYSKASQLCLLSDAQIAILATPSSSNSNVSFYSFGHSSVDAVVSAFLSGQRPVPPVPSESKQTREDIGICLARKDLGLGFWWDEESLRGSENPKEIDEAIESMKILLSEAKRLRSEDAVNMMNQRDHHQAFVDGNDLKKKKKKKKKSDYEIDQEPNQTLNLHSTSAICCIPEYLQDMDTEISEDFCFTDNNNNNNIGTDQILNPHSSSAICCIPEYLQDMDTEISENFCFADNNNNLEAHDLDQTINLDSNCGILDDCFRTGTEMVVLDDDDLPENLNNNNEEQDQILPVSDNFCNSNDLTAGKLDDEEIDFDQLIEFETSFESLFSDQELEEFAATLWSEDNNGSLISSNF